MPDVFISSDKETTPKTPPVLPTEDFQEEHKAKGMKHSHRSRFASFNLYPEHINFETRRDDEKIILMLRQHPVINLKWIFITAVLLFVPSVLIRFGLNNFLPSGYEFVFSLIWYLVTFTYALEGFLSWYFNVYFITTHRIIDVDFFNLIDKKVSDAEIEMIQDVSYTTKGVLGTALNYGDVIIQTASEVPEFDFGSVPSPDKVLKILNDLRMKTK